MTSKQLNRLFEKNKAEYLAEIRNLDGSYTCKGCDCDFMTIETHHIIKRSRLRYYYADKRNFIHLCLVCHKKTEGTLERQMELLCYDEMSRIMWTLIDEYNSLSPSGQSLLFKYGK